MRAYQLKATKSIDDLVMVDLPMPKPQYRQVLVKVGACSLNYRDLAIATGGYRGGSKPNVIPLSDGAGEVVEIGPGVQRVKVGDKVAGNFSQRWLGGPASEQMQGATLGGAIDGMLAEYVVLEEDGTVKLPPGFTLEEGATLPCAGVTAWHAVVEHARTTAGETVLIQGTGGVSIFALQFAKLHGATVIVTSSSDEKLAKAKKLGANHTINYKTTPDWDKAAMEITGGRGVDLVVEVGGAGTMVKSFGAIRVNGKISVIGVLSAPAGDFNPMLMLAKRADIQGIGVGSALMFEAMNRALAANNTKPAIDKVFPFEQTLEAYRYLKSAAHFGKIVIKVGGA